MKFLMHLGQETNKEFHFSLLNLYCEIHDNSTALTIRDLKTHISSVMILQCANKTMCSLTKAKRGYFARWWSFTVNVAAFILIIDESIKCISLWYLHFYIMSKKLLFCLEMTSLRSREVMCNKSE